LFSRTGQQGAAHGRTSGRQRGEDHHAKVLLELVDVYRGTSRKLTLQMPAVDPQGRVKLVEHVLDVRIPKGVREGQLIRLAGQGGAAADDGGTPGDLYLEVHFQAHARYRIEGLDVYASLPVAPWEAMLGASVNAPLPDGTVEVRIPEGSQAGRKLRLRGRGIPAAQAGDLYLVLEIVLPAASSDRARELYQTMARELAFNPRQALES